MDRTAGAARDRSDVTITGEPVPSRPLPMSRLMSQHAP
jgi:hypothetical protein